MPDTATALGIIIGLIFVGPLTIIPTRKFLKPTVEKAFYTWILPPIALIYIGFSIYYQDLSVLPAEIVGVLIFTGFAIIAHFWGGTWLALGYVAHGLWELAHEMFKPGLVKFIPWTQVPIGYAAFCLTYDVVVAGYIVKRRRAWDGTRPNWVSNYSGC